MGDARGSALAQSLRRDAIAVLRRHGHHRAQIRVDPKNDGMYVRIEIPEGPTRVRTLVLHLD